LRRNLLKYNKKAMINKKKTTQWHKEKVQQKNLSSTKRKLHNERKKKYNKKTMINRKKTTQWWKEIWQKGKQWSTQKEYTEKI
jgi:hypothetical protein